MLISWSKSECGVGNGWLHKYNIIKEYSDASMEMCERCKDIQVFKTKNGRVHNINYLAYHLRSALPRHHKLYNREYGI